jgi:DNA polymerase elongation subunit (family B)
LINSRNCYELIRRGFVISRSINNHERIHTLNEIIAKDKGGMIFSAKIGLHENISVLDYENEYANLIVKHNLSYETVTSTTDGRITLKKRGLGSASNNDRKLSQETYIFQEFADIIPR